MEEAYFSLVFEPKASTPRIPHSRELGETGAGEGLWDHLGRQME